MVKDCTSYLHDSIYYSKNKEIKMSKELSEDSKFEISIKTLIAIGVDYPPL